MNVPDQPGARSAFAFAPTSRPLPPLSSEAKDAVSKLESISKEKIHHHIGVGASPDEALRGLLLGLFPDVPLFPPDLLALVQDHLKCDSTNAVRLLTILHHLKQQRSEGKDLEATILDLGNRVASLKVEPPSDPAKKRHRRSEFPG